MVDQAEIHRKVMSGEVGERAEAVNLLRDNFADLPDKEEAWKDLIRLTKDEDWNVPRYAADALGSAFLHVPAKEEAWDDLIWLIGDTGINVRWNVAEAIGSAFLHTPHKKHVWRDLHHLTHYEDGCVRSRAARALGSAFSHVPEKEKAWKDLHRLTRDDDADVRRQLSTMIGSVFPHVPDKEEVWEDMIRLMGDEDPDVRLNVAGVLDSSVLVSEHALDSIFQHIIKNEKAWKDLQCLTRHEDGHIRIIASYSLGRASLLKTTNAESEDDFKIELKNAIDFFKISSKGAAYFGDYCRSSLYFPFYKLFYIIIFENAGAESEVQKYLNDAKSASKRSENGEIFLEVVENIANALAKVHGDRKSDLGTIKRNLNTYRRDCDCAADLIGFSEDVVALARVFEYVLECVQESIHIPKIQTVHISETQKKIVRIAVVQFCFDLTESFPFAVKNRNNVKTKIFSALDIAKQDGADIVCLPELCLCEEWISEIEERCPNMIIIGGSFYKDNQNTCPVIMESDAEIPYQPKITPSPFEHGTMGPRMMPGDIIYRYETRFGKFVILICMDFDDLAHFFRETDIDMIFCPSFNSANERFHNEAHSPGS
jgi:HEAT repeat protein